jgi:hypothetical protein
MLSKLAPWDFLQKHPMAIDPKKPGLYAFLIEDPFLERVILDRIPKKDSIFALFRSGSQPRFHRRAFS